MSALKSPQLRALSKEDFPDQSIWIEPLLRSVNGISAAVNSLVSAINAQVTTLTVDLDVPSAYASAFPKVVATGMSGLVTHAMVTAAYVRDNRDTTITNATKALWLEWDNSTDAKGARALRIKNVSGLTVSTNYRLTLRLEG